jgi:hypothetical protein
MLGVDILDASNSQDIALSDDEILIAINLDFAPRILGVDHTVAYLNFHRYFGPIVKHSAWTHCYNFALLRLVFGGIGKNDSSLSLFLCFNGFEYNSIS